MVWIELCVLLACILVGARVGGIALGTVAGLGLVVLVFIFGLPPGMPPRTVLGMIVAVVTAAATMQAAGGLNYLAAVADRALRVWPGGITIIAPLVTYVVTFAAGTVHIVYALLPVIAEVSRKAGVRPERPLSIATIAAQQAVTASPISAATVALLALLTPQGVQLKQILLICVPATLLGSLIGALAVLRKGPELEDDPIYKQRLAQGLISFDISPVSLTGQQLSRARGSVIVFLLAAVLVVVLGFLPSLRPTYTAVSGGQESIEQLDMAPAIMMMMFAAAGVNMLLFRASAAETIKTSIMSAGMVALISIAGLGWLGSSFFEGNKQLIVGSISGVVQQHPWVFALGLFALSILLASQAATVVTLMPVALGLGLGAPALIAMFPAVNGYFFLPTYATMLAAISFDQTGTTRIGKYVLNHSFMLPGMVATVSSVSIGFLLAKVVF
ncbi:MAG TPA: anaerobic C4-dicarboxylate transporter family protein [Terriglobales bacterium]|nr:anaerobic C4-dicarboxylate transporter family protein [Terriglobales bacterium]